MKVSTSRCGVDASVWGAHAPRVLALAPSPARTFSTAVCPGKMVESSLRFPKTELVAARRRDRHARRVRSPEADSARLISILECIRALEARPRCPSPRLDVLAAAHRK